MNFKFKLPVKKLGSREQTIFNVCFFTLIVVAIMIIGNCLPETSIAANFKNVNQAPSWKYPFGTDWIGRNMLCRTLKGLSLSIWVGIICSICATILGMVFGILAPIIGGVFDTFVCWLVDLLLSIPHTVLVILISIAVGGGFKGIVIGVTVTHWTGLCRVIRAEVMQIMESEFYKNALKFGKSKVYICVHHMFPHIVPQLVVSTILLFPHAIIHEASITFLGFGLPAHKPAIGIILSESMKFLTSGQWWLAFFPGLSLVLISIMVARIGRNLEQVINPVTAYKI